MIGRAFRDTEEMEPFMLPDEESVKLAQVRPTHKLRAVRPRKAVEGWMPVLMRCAGQAVVNVAASAGDVVSR